MIYRTRASCTTSTHQTYQEAHAAGMEAIEHGISDCFMIDTGEAVNGMFHFELFVVVNKDGEAWQMDDDGIWRDENGLNLTSDELEAIAS